MDWPHSTFHRLLAIGVYPVDWAGEGLAESLNYRDQHAAQCPLVIAPYAFCDHENCNGVRVFRCVSGKEKELESKDYEFFYVTYRCSNCQRVEKTFSLAAKVNVDAKHIDPPPVSPKLIKLIGPDRAEFLKGRRCENQRLGVGAFIYYRRVVENQKNRILGEIIKVSEKIRCNSG